MPAWPLVAKYNQGHNALPQHAGTVWTHAHTYKTQIIKQVLHLNHTVLNPCHDIALTRGDIHTSAQRQLVRQVENYYRRNCQVGTSAGSDLSCTALKSGVWFAKKLKVNQHWWDREVKPTVGTRVVAKEKELRTIKNVLALLGPGRWLVRQHLLLLQIWAVCNLSEYQMVPICCVREEKYHRKG